MASAQAGFFQAKTNRHRARRVRRTRGGAPECGLPSPRPGPRTKVESSELPLMPRPGLMRHSAFAAAFFTHRRLPNRYRRASSSSSRARSRAGARSSPSRRDPSSRQAGWRARTPLRQPGAGKPRFLAPEWNKSKNTGITSVDRSTKATLSTYNPRIQLSRLQKIYHFQHQKLICTIHTLPIPLVHTQKGRDLMLVL